MRVPPSKYDPLSIRNKSIILKNSTVLHKPYTPKDKFKHQEKKVHENERFGNGHFLTKMPQKLEEGLLASVHSSLP